MQGGSFLSHHVLVKRWRTPHRLAGVVDNKIQSGAGGRQVLTKSFHARCMAQVQAEDFQPVTPFGEIRLPRVTHRRVAWETRCHDQMSARAKQTYASLITNLHAATGEESYAPAQVRAFRALAKIQVGAFRTKLVVEMMDG